MKQSATVSLDASIPCPALAASQKQPVVINVSVV